MAIKKVIELDLQSDAGTGLEAINTEINKVAESSKSLKTQLREAQLEVATLADKFGATSKEAVNAAKKAGELKDKIGDAKALTDAFNPDAKFKALTASLGGVASGFAAYQGALGLAGVESKDLEEQLLKVQSAMAISQGLQSVGESIDSFKQLGAVVKSYSIVQKISTAAQWLWNAAMSANPLGAIVVAITAVIAAGYGLIKFFGTVEITSKKAMLGIQENTKALIESERISKKHNEALKDSSEYQLAMAKASGASASEIEKLSIKQADADISLKALNRTIAQNTYYRELNSLATLKASGATDEAIKMQNELVKKSLENFANENKALSDSVRNKKLIIQKGNVDELQAKTDLSQKLKDEAKKSAEDQRKIDEKNIQKNFLKTIPELDDSNVDLELSAIDAKNQAKLELDAKFKQDTLDAQAQFELQNSALIYDTEQARAEREEIAKQERIKRFEEQKEALFMVANNLANGLDAIESLGNKKSKAAAAIKKGIALVDLSISTASALGSAVKEARAAGAAAQLIFPMVPGAGIAASIASYASSAAMVFGNISKAKALLGGGSSGGGGGGTSSSGGGAPAAPAPQFNVVGNTGINQIASSIGAPQPVQAYVVAGAVTTGQALNRNIISNASMG